MLETLEENQFTDVFAQFRSEARAEIKPPGSDLVRRTVRQRRTVRFAATAALALVGLAGVGLVITKLPGSPTVTPPVPGESAAAPSYGPTLSPDRLEARGLEALEMLGYQADDKSSRLDLLPIRPGIVYGGLDSSTDAFSYGLGTAAQPLPAGDYYIDASCAGPGQVTLTWTAPGGERGSVALDCGGLYSQPLAVRESGVVTLTVDPDEQATHRAGFAFAVTDPRIIRVRGLLEPAPNSQVFGGSGLLTASQLDKDETDHPAGSYLLTVACAGTGAVSVTFIVGGGTATKSLVCTMNGALTTLTVTAPYATNESTVSITSDRAAPGEVAYAYRVTAG